MKKVLYILALFLVAHFIDVTAQNDTIEVVSRDTSGRSLIKPVYSIALFNIMVNRIDVHISNKDWAKVSPSTWWTNIKRGFMTDGDQFSTNWFGHPMHGAWFYNSARSSGLNYWQSLPYVAGGSLMWEYLGEIEPASEIDFYTTTLGGAYMGEVVYRFSDYFYNYPFKKNRKLYKVVAGIVNPYAGLNKLIFGYDIPATSASEIPVSAQFYFGTTHPFNMWVPDMKSTGTFIDLELTYGSLLDREVTKFGPFDYFTLKSWINFSRSNLSAKSYYNLTSHAILYGTKLSNERNRMDLISISQHYDFIHNDLFKIGSVVLTGDLWMHRKIGDVRMLASVKAGVVLFGSGSSEMVPNQYPDIFPEFGRDYIYGQGLMAESELVIIFRKWGTVISDYNYFRIYSREAPTGIENLQLYRLRYLYPLTHHFTMGVQYDLYKRDASYYSIRSSRQLRNNHSEVRFLVGYSF